MLRAQANDGSYVLLVCTWSVHKATSFAGPWSSALPINPTPVPLDPVAHWEVRQRLTALAPSSMAQLTLRDYTYPWC